MTDAADTPLEIVSGDTPWAMIPIWIFKERDEDGKPLGEADIRVFASLRHHADRNSGGCYPTAARIADVAGVAVGTARNVVQKLKKLGIIDYRPRYLASGARAGNSYFVPMLAPVRRIRGTALADVGGYTRWCRGVHQPMHPKELAIELATEQTTLLGDEPAPQAPPARRPAEKVEYDDPSFVEFWSVYPRKLDKRAAWKEWKAAIKRKADPQVIVAAARRYASEPGRELRFTKHPKTWLSQESYLNEAERMPQNRSPQPARPAPRRAEGPRCPLHSWEAADGCRECAAERMGLEEA